MTTKNQIESESCIFCAPPADRVFFRSESVTGLWDAFPVSPGHALLLPRRHIATLFDASREERLALLDAVDHAKRIIDERHRPDGYNVGINNGAAAGQTIFHLHVHLIPRHAGDVADPRGGVRFVIPDKANYLRADRGPAESTKPGVRG